MANVNSPFGAVAIGTSDGADYSGKLREVSFAAGDAAACFIGDLVKLTGTASVDGKTPVVAKAATDEAVVGVLVSLTPDFQDEGSLSSGQYRKASTARKGFVVMGSDVLYVMQASTALTAADAGQNANIVTGTGDTITGISGASLGAAIAAGATGQMRLRQLSGQIGNVLGQYALWEVNINENQDDHGAGV